MDRVFQEKTGVNNITNIIANTLSKDNEWDYQKYLNTESQSIRKFKDTFESLLITAVIKINMTELSFSLMIWTGSIPAGQLN